MELDSEMIHTSRVDGMYLDEDNDVPVIPDIEELHDQEFILQTAEPPLVEVNTLLNIDEIKEKIPSKHPVLSTLENANMSVLSDFCLPEEKIKESDSTWTWDSLIVDIMQKVDVHSLHD